MKFAIVMFMTMFAMGGVAEARSCPVTHGKAFCEVHAQRHAIAVYREKLVAQAKRTHITVHVKPMRKLTWNPVLIHKVNLWTRHMVKVLRARPTYVSIRLLADWLCIAHYESSTTWNIRGGTYWGGLQMDVGFMNTYGGDMIRKYGGRYADAWSPHDQMVVAERAYQTRGFEPWPNTSRDCGLR